MPLWTTAEHLELFAVRLERWIGAMKAFDGEDLRAWTQEVYLANEMQEMATTLRTLAKDIKDA